MKKNYSKVRRERYLPISLTTLQTIKKLSEYRHTDWKASTPILCTYDGRRMPSRSMQERFRDYSKIIGIHITPYHLRHMFALWFIKNGGHAFALQQIMGHSKMDMTRVYLNLSYDYIKQTHEQVNPLSRILPNKRVKNI